MTPNRLHTSRARNRDTAPFVVVGSGTAGMRLVEEIRRCNPGQSIVLFGNEGRRPYNRTALSDYLAGRLSDSDLEYDLDLPDSQLETCFDCEVVKIDRSRREVITRGGWHQPYSKLFLALGTRAHLPSVFGLRKPGCFVLHTLNDANQLMARTFRSRQMVIVGGGVLGVETALALNRHGTQITLIDHASQLLSHHVDEQAEAKIVHELELAGIRVMNQCHIKWVFGEDKVEGLLLSNGKELSCDTLVFTAGIRANIELARQSGLSVGLGIRVNEHMQTRDPSIYAVGSCTEFDGFLQDNLDAIYRQAEVAASHACGYSRRYRSPPRSTTISTPETHLHCIGLTAEHDLPRGTRSLIYSDSLQGLYRRIFLLGNRPIGAISTGHWQELSRLKHTIGRGERLYFWNFNRFRHEGYLWPDNSPASAQQRPSTFKRWLAISITSIMALATTLWLLHARAHTLNEHGVAIHSETSVY